MPETIDANSTSWVTLDDLKQHTNITSFDGDDELHMVLSAAHDVVEGIVGPIRWRTMVESLDVRNTRALLGTIPVVSITSADIGGSPAAYVLDPDVGSLAGLSNWGTLTVTYVAGRSSVPDALRLATLIIAAHLWETQRGNAPSALPFDDGSNFVGPVGIGYAIPNRALDLLAPSIARTGLY